MMETMTRKDKIKAIRKIAGVKKFLSWGRICQLTEFDSFATCFSFGFQWKKECPNDRLVCFPDSYINMIYFNLTAFPKDKES